MHDVTLADVGLGLPFLPHPVSYYLQLLLIQTHGRTPFLTGSRAATLVCSALVTEDNLCQGTTQVTGCPSTALFLGCLVPHILAGASHCKF